MLEVAGAVRAGEPSSDLAPALAPPPRANPDLLGHEAAESALRRLHERNRLPHAILLSGPRGIGKATLAFRLARFLLAQNAPDATNAIAAESAGLAIDPVSGVFHRIAAGGHADLLTVERAWDPKRRRLRGEIVVEDAREITAFLRLTSAEGGWRIVIVDGAEEMNANAANSLLKILEEPPQRVLVLLVSHNPGRLLPTIRSRCRRMPLMALAPLLVRRLLAQYRPDLAAPEAGALAALAEGSIGRALELADADGLALYHALIEIIAPPVDAARGAGRPALDLARLHAFADRLVRPESEDGYRMATELLTEMPARLAAVAAGCPAVAEREGIATGAEAVLARLARGADPARWAVLHEESRRRFARADALNLDKKQALLGAVLAIARMAG
ncbi:MAG: DNA polymerase III subunit delta' [Stellaceae bacterium]